jgi:hypothetical protein
VTCSACARVRVRGPETSSSLGYMPMSRSPCRRVAASAHAADRALMPMKEAISWVGCDDLVHVPGLEETCS